MYTGVALGFITCSIPTAAMMIASAFIDCVNVPASIEAIFQNYAAGLILAAVGAELFPLMLDTNPVDGWVGMVVGFSCGLLLLHGFEALANWILTILNGKLMFGNFKAAQAEITPSILEEGAYTESFIQYVNDNKKRKLFHEHIAEILGIIRNMEEKAQRLFATGTVAADIEAASEEIDEAVHSLQYKVDRSRRLLIGSDSEWDTEEKKENLKNRLEALRSTASQIVEKTKNEDIDIAALTVIASQIQNMSQDILWVHDTVEERNIGGRRSRAVTAMEIPENSTIPNSLVVPVAMDCFVDGFLIGVAVALSPNAGFVLAGANTLEMSFLGMAYAGRLAHCTGSSFLSRKLALYLPCLLMFVAAGLGAFVGQSSKSEAIIFVSFVAFGVTALLSLVCTELLIEAREAQGQEPVWWIQIFIFAGVLTVLMLHHVL